MSVGTRIRDLRKAKGLTQSDLVGGEITRNMLSRIESDKALPSLSTLLFLAERLGVSPGYILDEERTLFEDKKSLFLPKLKAAYVRGNYREVLRLYERDLGECDDEVAYLLADASAKHAEELLHKGKMSTGEKVARDGLAFLEKSVYASEHLKAALSLLLAIFSSVQSPRYEVARLPYGAFTDSVMLEDLYRYTLESSTPYTYQSSLYGAHANAKKMMAEGRYADALYALEALENRRAEKDFSVFVLFRIYGDLETCHKELRNYEAAYRYSSKRISLLSAFKS